MVGFGVRVGLQVGLPGLLLGLVALALHSRSEPASTVGTSAPPVWAQALFEHQLPAISWATARVAFGEPKNLIELEVASLRATSSPRAVAKRLHGLARQLARPVIDPEVLRDHFEALNHEMQALGVPLYADVQIERVPPERGKWVVWIRTYRITAIRDVETSQGRYAVHWLERLDDLGLREDRLGWKKATESHATVLLDVVRRHWREDLAPRLVRNPRGRNARHLYAALREELLADLERATGGPITEGIECYANFGAMLWAESIDPVPDEARACWRLNRSLETAIVDALARRIEEHELQHAIDARGLKPPRVVEAHCGTDERCLVEATAEISAVLAESARGKAPRLGLAHFLSLGDELGGARGVASRVVLEVLGGEGEDAVSLLRRPRTELGLRARLAYRRLFGRDIPSAQFLEPAVEAVAGK